MASPPRDKWSFSVLASQNLGGMNAASRRLMNTEFVRMRTGLEGRKPRNSWIFCSNCSFLYVVLESPVLVLD